MPINKQEICLNQFSSFLNYYSIPRGKDCQFIFKLRKHLLFLHRLVRTEDSYRLPRISALAYHLQIAITDLEVFP